MIDMCFGVLLLLIPLLILLSIIMLLIIIPQVAREHDRQRNSSSTKEHQELHLFTLVTFVKPSIYTGIFYVFWFMGNDLFQGQDFISQIKDFPLSSAVFLFIFFLVGAIEGGLVFIGRHAMNVDLKGKIHKLGNISNILGTTTYILLLLVTPLALYAT